MSGKRFCAARHALNRVATGLPAASVTDAGADVFDPATGSVKRPPSLRAAYRVSS
jgi:hypothetical protein